MRFSEERRLREREQRLKKLAMEGDLGLERQNLVLLEENRRLTEERTRLVMENYELRREKSVGGGVGRGK